MKEKATIYDLWRVCRDHADDCTACPMRMCLYDFDCNSSCEEIDEMNEIILNWCKEHPVKTRQDKFLEMFPNVIKSNGIIDICPLIVENGHECLCDTEPITDCCDCRKAYWLAEVEE